MRTRFIRVFFCAGLLSALGCTKGVPGFELLDVESIPQPLFDNGSTSKTLQSATGAETPQIDGTCDGKIRAITAQAMDIDTLPGFLDNVTVSPASVTCSSNGKFSFQLKSLTGLGYALTEGKTYEIQFRSVTSAGASRASTLKIRYSTEAGSGSKRIHLTQGGTLSSGAERKVASANHIGIFNIVNRMPSYGSASLEGAMAVQVSSGGNFKAKFGAASAAD